MSGDVKFWLIESSSNANVDVELKVVDVENGGENEQTVATRYFDVSACFGHSTNDSFFKRRSTMELDRLYKFIDFDKLSSIELDVLLNEIENKEMKKILENEMVMVIIDMILYIKIKN